MDDLDTLILTAAQKIRAARRVIAFTGAGISVESGIPPFRGPNGLWSKYDPVILDIRYFQAHPKESWKVIKEIFYDFFGQARPNAAHIALAELERLGLLQAIITQNIDNLHQEAGNTDVIEYHGTSQTLACLSCGKRLHYKQVSLQLPVPRCPACGGLLKPDFVFFGEPIPQEAQIRSLQEVHQADVWLVIGTTGEIYPASLLPIEAHDNGATIIEVNIQPSRYTNDVSDIFLRGKATAVMTSLLNSVRSLQ